ncbi:putative hemolysin [Loktanella ponticola]|uniref:L-ornithine N(alpha)-acyltransferase n=1 Tax=Yoonia ponticola TaxID=1524255 RepID=A0A7W9BKE7_9RHOB|nr:GNAT family N-acetyltransferase [Yoonia ponticola]MBB5721981.1 putative hemolysin [Yoonia ponticola]
MPPRQTDHMNSGFQKGRYFARFAQDAADIAACQALRHQCFFGTAGLDADQFDAAWTHMMIEDGAGGPLVCTFRMRQSAAADIGAGYAGQFYDLTRLSHTVGPHIEIGRFCTDPATPDPHILRVAWGALTRHVDACDAKVLFGCTSLTGTDPAPYRKIINALHARHQGPAALMPRPLADEIIALDAVQPDAEPRPMPPLLRTYLAMGGWVSDHAVVDRVMQTLHVLTVVEIAKIPAARAKALRALV